MSNTIKWGLCTLVILLGSELMLGDDPESADQSDGKSDQSVQVVEEPIEVFHELDGTMESLENVEVKAETKIWKTLKILEVVPEGTVVSADEIIVVFEGADYIERLQASEIELKIARLSHEQARLERESNEKTRDWDVELAKRSLRLVQEDYRYFTDVDRPRREESSRFSLRMSEGSLENATEELEQLEKMYREDELTEESEEIILKRARRAVESSKFSLESARLRSQRTLEIELPREADQLTDGLRRAELEDLINDSKRDLDAGKKELAFQQAEIALKKLEKDHERLVADQDRLVLRAPADGVVYHGRCQRGKWVSGGSTSSRTLNIGQSVTPSQVLVTIVNPARMQIRMSLAESQLQQVKNGTQTLIMPAIASETSIPGKISSVATIPFTAGKFEALVEFDPTASGLKLMPGMTARVAVDAYSNPAAIVIPEELVDRSRPGRPAVHVTGPEGTQRRSIKLGVLVDDRREVLEGLKAGEKLVPAE